MGTPQMRWREMHQSGRVAIMLEMRSSPQLGSHVTFLISAKARARKVVEEPAGFCIGVSMLMNHCSVARKMTGLWQRQQCGYECSMSTRASSAPRDFRSSMIDSLASKTFLPSYSGK